MPHPFQSLEVSPLVMSVVCSGSMSNGSVFELDSVLHSSSRSEPFSSLRKEPDSSSRSSAIDARDGHENYGLLGIYPEWVRVAGQDRYCLLGVDPEWVDIAGLDRDTRCLPPAPL